MYMSKLAVIGVLQALHATSEGPPAAIQSSGAQRQYRSASKRFERAFG